MSQAQPRALLLSVGYGQGHHAAAAAIAEELAARGWSTRTEDPCALAHPHIFRATQHFYHFCVRRAPWLWGVTYAQTDTADWSRQVMRPIIRGCTERVRELLLSYRPDAVFCTYPLFAYMLDHLAASEGLSTPYTLVVTDAIEISRPWMTTRAPLICVPDEYSAAMACERYALSPRRLIATGFPVRRAFRSAERGKDSPQADTLRIVYGAFCSIRRCRDEIAALLHRFPRAHIDILAGERLERLRSALAPLGISPERRSIQLIAHTDRLHDLFADAHLYIGKAGAATVFEAYASGLPVIINYSLPGQEQGNLELLLRDDCGLYAEGPSDLTRAVEHMLARGAHCWNTMRTRMQSTRRAGGAAAIVNAALARLEP
ncbi:MAG TPA: hypothetical protein H9976_03275 [Candidatus Akkermansia intestinavium]|nr:hypothetical protein [Candidatus Akkermansia intestinavium]